MNLRPGTHLPGGPLKGWQTGVVFLPYLVLLVLPLNQLAYTRGSAWLLPAVGLPLLGLLVIVWSAGLVRQFPLWSLPALGILLSIANAVLYVLALMLVFIFVFLPFFGQWGWPEGDFSVLESVLIWLPGQSLSLVLITALVAGLLRIVPSFHARVRQEWTLLSFLLYGSALGPILLWDEEFHGVEVYQTASVLILALGAGLYLVVPRRWQRVLALIIPVFLAPIVMATGRYLAFPAQPWANPADPNFQWWEAIQPVLQLSTLPILMLLAGLAPRLPWDGEPDFPPAGIGTRPLGDHEVN